MRKFSNKSKKDKKNAIRRKTKGNRRNNKRRTYRKKVKGGNETHSAAQAVTKLVNDLETNVNNLINVINSITGKDIKVHNEVNRNLEIVEESLKELSKKKGSCGWPWKDIACEESKQKSYLKAVTNMQKLKNAAKTKLEDLKEKKLKDLKKLEIDRLTTFIIMPIMKVIEISETGIENMKKKATSRGIENMEEEATSSKELDFGEIYPPDKTVDTTTENPLNALIVN